MFKAQALLEASPQNRSREYLFWGRSSEIASTSASTSVPQVGHSVTLRRERLLAIPSVLISVLIKKHTVFLLCYRTSHVTPVLHVGAVFLNATKSECKLRALLSGNTPCTMLAHGLLTGKSEYRRKMPMIEQAKFSFDDQVSFDARWIQLEIPLNVSSTTNPSTDKLHTQFEDHRIQDGRNIPQTDWPFLTFWVSYAAAIVFIAVWALT